MTKFSFFLLLFIHSGEVAQDETNHLLPPHTHTQCVTATQTGGRTDKLLSQVSLVCVCSSGIYYQLRARQVTYSPTPLTAS